MIRKLFSVAALFLLCAVGTFANTAPTLVSYTLGGAFNVANGLSKSSAVVAWNAGDFIVVIAGSEASTAPGVPSGTGLTFTSKKSNAAAGTCGSQLATASPGAGGSSAITDTYANGVDHWGFAIYVWRNSNGLGNSAEQHTGTQTVSLTPLGGADSAIMWGVFDFSAGAIGSVTPAPTTTRENTQDGTHYTYTVADLDNQAGTGAVNYGTSGNSSGGPFSIVVMEVEGTSGGGGGTAPPPTMLNLGVGSLSYDVNQMVLNNFQGCLSNDSTCVMRAEVCDENLNCLLLPVGSHRLGLMFSRNGVRSQVATITFQVTQQ